MIRFRLLVLVVAMTTPTFAQDIVRDAGTYAMNETTTRPWSAPVGHRQPRAADIPASATVHIDPEDAIVDRKIRGVCRGLLRLGQCLVGQSRDRHPAHAIRRARADGSEANF